MCSPEISGANMDYVGYATPISAAKEYLPEEVVANPIFYPDEETLSHTEAFGALSPEISAQVDALWAEVKMGGPGDAIVLVAIILFFLAIYVAIIIWKRQKRKREMM